MRSEKGRHGLRNREKVFRVEKKRGDLPDMPGIGRNKGCMIVLRPDHVEHVLPLDGCLFIEIFEGIFRPARLK